MKDVNAIAKKALDYKEKGLSEKEIADELHLSPETVTWLLTRGVKGGEPPKDVKIGWRSIGVYGNRIGFMAAAMSDIALEEMEKRQMDADAVIGVAINGIPLAALISEELGKELIIYRPSQERHGKGGAFSSNYASPQGKKALIVDDVVSTGDTIKAAISDVHELGGTIVLAVVLVNKTAHDELAGVPLRALIRARSI
ncbi:MAG: orotate phosphoribosyltransferase-like protein [Methanobacteriota archaeon]|nr:MAG: orotate phosphoribosyltransferase-like protein [Euryarchaeota archaeon]TLZ66410.1 MAG: orotate phosphoribosyltransferase-like protein [Euryarchaeota archaeon]